MVVAEGGGHGGHIQFQHTQLGVYLVGACALLYTVAERGQEVLRKYHLNKRWYYLYGALCLSAYLYMLPFIRRGIGSAHRGYINLSTAYICWLMLAVFYHLPSLEALGFDVRADVSLALSVACYSVAALGALTGLQLLAVRLRICPPPPGAGGRELWTAVLFNGGSLAVACTTYYSLCGNGSDEALAARGASGAPVSPVRQAVCANF
ncbi:hypothetical protein Rsub_05574 [Raphidocelis subcapitata]|uniref:Uncharacterized protein n=1 Tax=Raphidocelis subcapitata TaxID=307507 RepID=A0A2V0P0C6_9CHLO|nr:hypothetical protein Rsub_05574 [Raphidocelis subcapitata]|eukprot:GBF92372.1 hypothetical protein Rsub_05574 [Raphidocelis subcapitata]